MQRIKITRNTMPDKHWLVYRNDNGDLRHVDLSGCAGSFERSTGYVSNDGLRGVGWRYEEGGQLCYELFNIGHTVMSAPLKPDIVQMIGYLIRGKKPEEAHRAFLEEFESALNRGGWKTVERKEVEQ